MATVPEALLGWEDTHWLELLLGDRGPRRTAAPWHWRAPGPRAAQGGGGAGIKTNSAPLTAARVPPPNPLPSQQPPGISNDRLAHSPMRPWALDRATARRADGNLASGVSFVHPERVTLLKSFPKAQFSPGENWV